MLQVTRLLFMQSVYRPELITVCIESSSSNVLHSSARKLNGEEIIEHGFRGFDNRYKSLKHSLFYHLNSLRLVIKV